MALAIQALAFAGVIFFQASGNPIVLSREAVLTIAYSAVGLVVATVVILSAVTLALWALNKVYAADNYSDHERNMRMEEDERRLKGD